MKLNERDAPEISESLQNAFQLTALPGQNLATIISREITRLINQDFNLLITTLYRLDISEKKLTEILANNPEADAGDLIAGLVIGRELEKFRSRAAFRTNDDIADEDKW